MLRRILVALSLLTAATATQAAEMEVTVEAEGGYSQADAEAALDILRDNCRPLGSEFWSDIETIELTIEEETAAYRMERGWKNSVHVRLKYSDDPQHGPAVASGIGVLAGHWLDFFLGGGDTPGIFVGKRVTQYLCGLSYTDGSDVFVPVPELKFIDR